jgi:hypothetical protein
MTGPEQKPESIIIGSLGAGRTFLSPELTERIKTFQEMDPEERERLMRQGRSALKLSGQLEQLRDDNVTEYLRSFGFDDQEIEEMIDEIPGYEYLSNEAKAELVSSWAVKLRAKLEE